MMTPLRRLAHRHAALTGFYPRDIAILELHPVRQRMTRQLWRAQSRAAAMAARLSQSVGE